MHIRRQNHEKCVFVFPRILVKDFQRFVLNHFANKRIILQKGKIFAYNSEISQKDKRKQAEAEVMPSSSLVEVEVGVKVGVEVVVGVEVGVKVGMEVEVPRDF